MGLDNGRHDSSMKKTSSKTESIKVPTAIAAGTPSVIAREVKLFINLLQTGEIDSLSDPVQQAGYSKPILLDLTNLDDIWKTVIPLLSLSEN